METVRTVRTILACIIVLLLGTTIYYIKSRNKSHGASVQIESIQTGLKKFHVTEQTPDRINWELWAESASLTSNETHSKLTKPRILIYLEKEKKPVEITADSGELDQKSKEITLSENVVAHSGKLRLETSQVFWSNDSGALKTDQPVLIVGENFSLTAIGMRAELKEQRLELISNVQGTLTLQGFPHIGLRKHQP